MPFLSPMALATACPRVMPMSSTVWWPSMCRSPSALMARSTRPWRATWSSMWSRKGTPVASSARPAPSRSMDTVMRVSLVLRVTSALRIRFRLHDRSGTRHWAQAAVQLGQAGAQGVEEGGVLGLGAHGDADALLQQRVGAVQRLDEHAPLRQPGHQARRVWHAPQDEVGGAGERLHAGQRRHGLEQGLAAGADGRG